MTLGTFWNKDGSDITKLSREDEEESEILTRKPRVPTLKRPCYTPCVYIGRRARDRVSPTSRVCPRRRLLPSPSGPVIIGALPGGN